MHKSLRDGLLMSKYNPVIDSPRGLVEGQRLDQPTFHALYEAMPPGARAELVNGAVLMPPPAGPPMAVQACPP